MRGCGSVHMPRNPESRVAQTQAFSQKQAERGAGFGRHKANWHLSSHDIRFPE